MLRIVPIIGLARRNELIAHLSADKGTVSFTIALEDGTWLRVKTGAEVKQAGSCFVKANRLRMGLAETKNGCRMVCDGAEMKLYADAETLPRITLKALDGILPNIDMSNCYANLAADSVALAVLLKDVRTSCMSIEDQYAAICGTTDLKFDENTISAQTADIDRIADSTVYQSCYTPHERRISLSNLFAKYVADIIKALEKLNMLPATTELHQNRKFVWTIFQTGGTDAEHSGLGQMCFFQQESCKIMLISKNVASEDSDFRFDAATFVKHERFSALLDSSSLKDFCGLAGAVASSENDAFLRNPVDVSISAANKAITLRLETDEGRLLRRLPISTNANTYEASFKLHLKSLQDSISHLEGKIKLHMDTPSALVLLTGHKQEKGVRLEQGQFLNPVRRS